MISDMLLFEAKGRSLKEKQGLVWIVPKIRTIILRTLGDVLLVK